MLLCRLFGAVLFCCLYHSVLEDVCVCVCVRVRVAVRACERTHLALLFSSLPPRLTMNRLEDLAQLKTLPSANLRMALAAA